MENLVSLVAAGLLKVLLVNLLDSRVFVRLTERHRLVEVVENLSSLSSDVNEVSDAHRNLRLTAAVYTAAGTSHDLDEL